MLLPGVNVLKLLCKIPALKNSSKNILVSVMKSKYILFLNVLAAGFLFGWSHQSFAFGCTSSGLSVGGTGTYTIPVDVVLDKANSDITLSDLSTYTSCRGYLGWAGPGGPAANDALRTYGVGRFSSALSALGFTGYALIGGRKNKFPLSGGLCVWPDAQCYHDSSTYEVTRPINIIIGMTQTGSGNLSAASVPAGTEIARFTLEQRGTLGGAPPSWGNNLKTWIFVLKNKIVVPSYTCEWNNPNQTVTLPPVMKTDLINNGTGKYPEPTPFKLNLTCAKETTVSVQFDGTLMTGKTDVLANSASENQDVGIQLVYNSLPVKFAQKVKVINNADTQETLSYQAHYYYNGGTNIQGGAVNATTTVTFTYQ